MKNLFDAEAVAEVNARVASLTPDSTRVWGKMNVAQMVAHCAKSMRYAVGDTKPPRMLIGRVIGPLVRNLALGPKPMGRNAPTSPDLKTADERELGREQSELISLIDRFAAAGPSGCTTHPHTFFGALDAQQWARLMYKHLDHHLTQFSA